MSAASNFMQLFGLGAYSPENQEAAFDRMEALRNRERNEAIAAYKAQILGRKPEQMGQITTPLMGGGMVTQEQMGPAAPGSGLMGGQITPQDAVYQAAAIPGIQKTGIMDALTRGANMGPGDAGPKIGTYNPRDYTPESWAKFVKTKNPSVLVRYETSYNERIAADQGLASAVARSQAEIEGSKQRAKSDQSLSVKTMEAANTQVEKIGLNIRNLDEVIRLVDVEGANTGPLMDALPSFKESSIQLQNMKNRLGLDVIGSVTMGALSEKELKMAMDTGLPTKLRGPALVAWAKRKREAQAKLRDYLVSQVQYLNAPGATVAGWRQDISQRKSGQNKPISDMTDAELEAIVNGR